MTTEKKAKKEKKEHDHGGEDESWSFDSKRFRGPKCNKDFAAALFHYIKSTIPKDAPPEQLIEAAADLTDERVMRYYNINFGGSEAALPDEEVIGGWVAHLQKRAKKDKKKKRREKQDEGAASPARSESERSDKNGKSSPKEADGSTPSPTAQEASPSPRVESSPERRSSKDIPGLKVKSSSRRSSKDLARRGSKSGDLHEHYNSITSATIVHGHMSAHSLDFELSESVVSQRRSTILDAADDELVDSPIDSASSAGSKDGSLQRNTSSNQNNQSFKLQPVASVYSTGGGSLGGSLGEKSPLSSAPPTPVFKESSTTNSAPPTPIFREGNAPPQGANKGIAAAGVKGAGPPVRGAGRGVAPPKPPQIVRDPGGIVVLEPTTKKSHKEAKDVITLFNHQRILTSGSQALVFEDKAYRCRYDLQILGNMSSVMVTFYSSGQFVYTSTSTIDLGGKHITSLYWTMAKPVDIIPQEVVINLTESDFWTTASLNTNQQVLNLLIGSKSDKATVLFTIGPVGSYSCYISGKKSHTQEILTPKHVYQKP